MDGRQIERKHGDRPIAKPDFPLPSVFFPGKRSELPTRRNGKEVSRERAFFYKKPSDKNGPPVYGFYITDEPIEQETNT